MFTDIFKLIEEKEYDSASQKLLPLCRSDNEEVASKANYLYGYIYMCRDNKKRNLNIAKRALLFNMNSKFSKPLAYVWYTDVEKDSNIAINYLNKGIQKYPKDARLYSKLFQLSSNKDELIEEIRKQDLNDIQILEKVISYLISSRQWDKIRRFIFRIRNGNELTQEQDMYLILIEAYSYLFANNPNYEKASEYFKQVLLWDSDNEYAYSHYIGIIYAYIKLNNLKSAMEYFDKLPISNAIYDLEDVLYPLDIDFNFQDLYDIIFNDIKRVFSKDRMRKSKAQVIYSMYLYYPSEFFDTYRYKKSDAIVLSSFFKKEYNLQVGIALYNMRCHFKQYIDAYEVLCTILNNNEKLEGLDISFSTIIDNVSREELNDIAEYTLTLISNENLYDKAFLKYLFSDLISCLHTQKLYNQICKISDYFPISSIFDSDVAFECAYAYAKEDNARAIDLYTGIIQKNPNNSSALNNLGVRYEHKKMLYEALIYYGKALELTPSDEIIINNYNRVYNSIEQSMKEDIYHINDMLSLEAMYDIGYTLDFCKKIYSIKETIMRDILLRDIKECAVAIIAGQDKLAAIMCGSIIEAMLMERINELSITEYDLSELKKRQTPVIRSISDMSLNELLFVANKEKLIDTSIYHLGHYVRDYRNIVHPAREKRMKEFIDHGTVIIMWDVLKKITSQLY